MTRPQVSVRRQLVERAGLIVGLMAVVHIYAAAAGGFAGWGAVAVGTVTLLVSSTYGTWRLRQPTTRAEVCVLAAFCAALAWFGVGFVNAVGERRADVDRPQPVVVVVETGEVA